MICEKDNTKYAIIKDEILGVSMQKFINLKCFEEYNYISESIGA